MTFTCLASFLYKRTHINVLSLSEVHLKSLALSSLWMPLKFSNDKIKTIKCSCVFFCILLRSVSQVKVLAKKLVTFYRM